MRYIKLTEEEQQYLKDRYLHGKNQVERRRSHCLLLSHRGYSIGALSQLFSVRYATVLDWFNNWEKQGRNSIGIKAGRGPKYKLRAIPGPVLAELISRYRRNLQGMVGELEDKFQLSVSKKTLQRFLKTKRV